MLRIYAQAHLYISTNCTSCNQSLGMITIARRSIFYLFLRIFIFITLVFGYTIRMLKYVFKNILILGTMPKLFL